MRCENAVRTESPPPVPKMVVSDPTHTGEDAWLEFRRTRRRINLGAVAEMAVWSATVTRLKSLSRGVTSTIVAEDQLVLSPEISGRYWSCSAAAFTRCLY